MWKDVIGYEGLYKVNEYGDIFSVRSGRNLKQSICSSGYFGASLTKDGKKKTEMAHRMVAMSFLGENDHSKNRVNHIDGNKLNNNLTNLEWVTAKENTSHAIDIGIMKVHGEEHPFYGKKHTESAKRRMSEAAKLRVGVNNPKSKPVIMCDIETHEHIMEFENQRRAAEYLNISQGNIGSVLAGKRNHAGGYYWKYA